MSRNKPSRDHTSDLPSPVGPARFSAFFRGRWRAVRAPVGMGFSFAIGMALLLGGALNIGPAISAAEGHGTHGYYIARDYYCTGRHSSYCQWKGDFATRPGGPAVRTDVEFKGHLPAGIHAGEVVPAVDAGSPFEVFQPGNRAAWLGALALIVLGGIWVLAMAGLIVMRFRSGRWMFPVSQ
jgi:hypothetical protein